MFSAVRSGWCDYALDDAALDAVAATVRLTAPRRLRQPPRTSLPSRATPLPRAPELARLDIAPRGSSAGADVDARFPDARHASVEVSRHRVTVYR